jgi:hypothetical protein
MDPFQNFPSQFNPQLYESSNVPPSTDKLFSFSGFQAGLMTQPNVIGHIPASSSSSSSTSNIHASSSSSSSSSHLPPQQQLQHLQYRQQQFIQQPPPQFIKQQQQQQPMIQQPSNNFMPNPITTNSATNIDNIPSIGSSGAGGTRYSGMYANTGFDMLSILSRVANR